MEAILRWREVSLGKPPTLHLYCSTTSTRFTMTRIDLVSARHTLFGISDCDVSILPFEFIKFLIQRSLISINISLAIFFLLVYLYLQQAKNTIHKPTTLLFSLLSDFISFHHETFTLRISGSHCPTTSGARPNRRRA